MMFLTFITSFLLVAILVRVDSSSQRLLGVGARSLERDPESAVGPWRCIRAGWAGVVLVQDAGSRLRRAAETQLLPLLPGCSSLADVSARLVHQAKLLFTPNTCV